MLKTAWVPNLPREVFGQKPYGSCSSSRRGSDVFKCKETHAASFDIFFDLLRHPAWENNEELAPEEHLRSRSIRGEDWQTLHSVYPLLSWISCSENVPMYRVFTNLLNATRLD